jgi:hypothetical protein
MNSAGISPIDETKLSIVPIYQVSFWAELLGATSAGLQLPSEENKASSVIGIAAGVLSSSLAIPGIRARKGGTRLFDFSSNMLAELFDRSTLGDGRYNPIVFDRVTSQPSDKLLLTIDDLEDRSAMLEDVRAKISFLKRDLAALLLSLPAH